MTVPLAATPPVVGVFANHYQAEQAYRELSRLGLGRDRLALLLPPQDGGPESPAWLFWRAGVAEGAARRHERDLEVGHSLVVVGPDGPEAAAVLRRFGARIEPATPR